MRPRKDPTRRNQILMGLFLAFIMVASSVGFFVGQTPPGAVKYGKYTFTQLEQGGYQTKIGKQPFMFFFLPQDVETIDFPPEAKTILRGSVVIVTNQPNMTPLNLQLADQLRFDLRQRLGITVIPGRTEPDGSPFPVLTCANASVQEPAVILEEANETKAALEGVCLSLRGNESGLYMLRDRLLYEHFGVIHG